MKYVNVHFDWLSRLDESYWLGVSDKKLITCVHSSEDISHSATMEPATKKRKSVMDDGFELLSRIYR